MDFLDTNILVYAISRRAEDAKKAAVARALIQPTGQAVSLQVLQEFYRVATHPKKLGYTHDEAVAFCDGWRRTFTLKRDSAVFLAATNMRTNGRNMQGICVETPGAGKLVFASSLPDDAKAYIMAMLIRQARGK